MSVAASTVSVYVIYLLPLQRAPWDALSGFLANWEIKFIYLISFSRIRFCTRGECVIRLTFFCLLLLSLTSLSSLGVGLKNHPLVRARGQFLTCKSRVNNKMMDGCFSFRILHWACWVTVMAYWDIWIEQSCHQVKRPAIKKRPNWR